MKQSQIRKLQKIANKKQASSTKQTIIHASLATLAEYTACNRYYRESHQQKIFHQLDFFTNSYLFISFFPMRHFFVQNL